MAKQCLTGSKQNWMRWRKPAEKDPDQIAVYLAQEGGPAVARKAAMRKPSGTESRAASCRVVLRP